MDIFENLENLNVSEECFDEIMGLVEEYISERNKENKEKKNEWEKDNATDLKIKRTLDSDTIRQLELNDPGSVKRMKEGTKKNLLGVSDIKVFRDENKKVSEACFNDIMGVVEDLIEVTQKNLKDAENKHNKYVDRIKKVVMSKKENGTLDDATVDKAMNKVLANNKYAEKAEKAKKLASKATMLPKSTDYLEGNQKKWDNLTKNERGKLKHFDHENDNDPPKTSGVKAHQEEIKDTMKKYNVGNEAVAKSIIKGKK